MTDSVSTSTEEYAFFRSLYITESKSGVDRALQCVCLRCATEDGIDRAFNMEQKLCKDHTKLG